MVNQALFTYIKMLWPLLWLLVVASCSPGPNATLKKRGSDTLTPPQEKPTVAPAQSNSSVPCKFPDPLNRDRSQQDILADQLEYQRKTRGYPQDVSIEEAVTQFNTDARCNDIGKHQPPLTTDELAAALADVTPQEGSFSKPGLAAFQEATRRRRLPKGSLIWFDWGYNQAGIEVRY